MAWQFWGPKHHCVNYTGSGPPFHWRVLPILKVDPNKNLHVRFMRLLLGSQPQKSVRFMLIAGPQCWPTLQEWFSATLKRGRKGWLIWVFPKIGVPQNGWSMMENPMKMDDLRVYHYFWKHPFVGWNHTVVFLHSNQEYGDRPQESCPKKWFSHPRKLLAAVVTFVIFFFCATETLVNLQHYAPDDLQTFDLRRQKWR